MVTPWGVRFQVNGFGLKRRSSMGYTVFDTRGERACEVRDANPEFRVFEKTPVLSSASS